MPVENQITTLSVVKIATKFFPCAFHQHRMKPHYAYKIEIILMLPYRGKKSDDIWSRLFYA